MALIKLHETDGTEYIVNNVIEAIESLNYMIGGECTGTPMDYVEEIEIAIKALGKQIPKKTQIKTEIEKDEDCEYECIQLLCHTCNNSVGGGYKDDDISLYHKYCPECGQRIATDWED